MGHTPDWLRGEPDLEHRAHTGGISMWAVIAWLAAIAITADALFLAQRYIG
jgi:hypothetical protein